MEMEVINGITKEEAANINQIAGDYRDTSNTNAGLVVLACIALKLVIYCFVNAAKEAAK